MKVWWFDAKYLPFVEAEISRALRHVKEDKALRALASPYSAIHESQIDASAAGDRYIIVGATLDVLAEVTPERGK